MQTLKQKRNFLVMVRLSSTSLWYETLNTNVESVLHISQKETQRLHSANANACIYPIVVVSVSNLK